jgi:hypothetical protein
VTSRPDPGRLTRVGAWLLAVLAAVGVLLLSAGTASAHTMPGAGNRVRACVPETITAVGVSEHIAAGQGRGPPVLQGQIVVATGVAADPAPAEMSAEMRALVAKRAGFASQGEPLIVDNSIGVNPGRVAAALRADGYNARSVIEIFGRDPGDPAILWGSKTSVGAVIWAFLDLLVRLRVCRCTR